MHVLSTETFWEKPCVSVVVLPLKYGSHFWLLPSAIFILCTRILSSEEINMNKWHLSDLRRYRGVCNWKIYYDLVTWCLSCKYMGNKISLSMKVAESDADSHNQDRCSIYPNEQVVSLQSSHFVIEDNIMKKIMTHPRIKVNEDCGHAAEIIFEWIHTHIQERKSKGKVVNQVHYN